MQDPIYSKIESTPRPTLFAASGLILVAAAGLWLSELILLLLPQGLSSGLVLQNVIYYLPFMVLPALLYARRRPRLGDALRLNPLPLLPTLSVVLLGILSVYMASLLATAWGVGLDALGLRSAGNAAIPGDEGSLALTVLMMAALPAACEELLFRGFVLSAWESRGTRFAIGVTAGLFALLHGNLYGLPAYALVGTISGFVTWALDSVYAGMIYHTVYNAACLIIPRLVAGSGDAAEAGSLSVFSLALEVLMICAMMAMVLSTLRLHAHQKHIAPIPRIRRPLERRDKVMLAAALAVMIGTLVLVQLLAMGIVE